MKLSAAECSRHLFCRLQRNAKVYDDGRRLAAARKDADRMRSHTTHVRTHHYETAALRRFASVAARDKEASIYKNRKPPQRISPIAARHFRGGSPLNRKIPQHTKTANSERSSVRYGHANVCARADVGSICEMCATHSDGARDAPKCLPKYGQRKPKPNNGRVCHRCRRREFVGLNSELGVAFEHVA